MTGGLAARPRGERASANRTQPVPRAWRGGLFLGLSLALVGLAASWWARRTPTVRQPGLSVLLITVDTLRADALGAYGRAAAGTPWMDRLASSGVRFDRAHAHNVVTLPSHANILSGRHPFDHGVRDNSGFRFPEGMDTLATHLRSRGYRTAAFVSAFPLASRFGLARGFDVYDDSFASAEGRPAFIVQERSGLQTVARARRWIAEPSSGPFFCWVHVYEPHFPYEPPEPYASRFLEDRYQGEVAATDALLGPLLEPLLGTKEAPLVVLTADHGESLGEHGEATHGIFAYEATLRVPLILHQPRLFAPRSVSEPAGHVDLLPTILDALAVPLPERLPGRSLLPAATGQRSAPVTTYFEALSGQLNRGWAPLFGVVQGDAKYVELPIPELYDLGRDAQELRDISSGDPARAAELRGLLERFRSADKGSTPSPESSETLERLRSLGYVSAAAPKPERYTAEDDPKRLIALDAVLHEVVGLYMDGDKRRALERCRELVARRPTMAVSLLTLAHLEREGGDLGSAVESLRKAVALSPGDPVALSLLGGYLTQAGRAREAVAVLEPRAKSLRADVDVRISLALALAKLSRFGESLGVLEKASAAEPHNGMVWVNSGTVHLMKGDRGRAREAFERALSVNPDTARALSSLAFMAAEEGRAEAALDHFRKALGLDSRESEKLLALGLGLRGAGRRAAARPFLELYVAAAPPSLYAREIERVRGWLDEG